MSPVSMFSGAFGLALLSFLLQPDLSAPQGPGNQYIGAKACKMCHGGPGKGDPHGIWSKTDHAKAFATLGTDKAKAIAKKAGIDEAQKSDQCTRCHVTAFDAPAAEIKRGFKHEDGVQCESCHGPGENHRAARTKAMAQDPPPPVARGEILTPARSLALCTKCHNQQSPTYQAFCLKERMARIEHLDPRRQRSEKDLEQLRGICTCDKCEAAKKKAADGN